MSSYISEEYYKKLQQATVIWGHSGIGKSYLYQNRREDIIDFDFQYKGMLGTLLAFPDLIKDEGLTKEESLKLYNRSRILVDKLFDLAIEEAKTSNKRSSEIDNRISTTLHCITVQSWMYLKRWKKQMLRDPWI